MGRMIAALMLMAPLSVGATAQQRFEILGGTIELPAAAQEAPEGDEKCEPRSPWLTPMLATHAGLQIADAHSTRRAIEAGGEGAQPLLQVGGDERRPRLHHEGRDGGPHLVGDRQGGVRTPSTGVVGRNRGECPVRVRGNSQLPRGDQFAGGAMNIGVRFRAAVRQQDAVDARVDGRDPCARVVALRAERSRRTSAMSRRVHDSARSAAAAAPTTARFMFPPRRGRPGRWRPATAPAGAPSGPPTRRAA